MTFQDPGGQRKPDDYIDRAGAGIGWAPLVLIVAFVAVVGFLLFGSPRQTDQPTVSERTEVPSTKPGAPSLPAPAPPTPQ
jgi:hypothetical protein